MNKPKVCPSCQGSGQATDQLRMDGMGRSLCARCKGDGTVPSSLILPPTPEEELAILEQIRRTFDGTWL